MELRQLRYLISVVEEGGVRRAADRLHIAQPAVGRQIRMLEVELGFALLKRVGRSVHPTNEAIELVTRARGWLADIDRAKKDLAGAAAGCSGRVTMGYVDDVLFGRYSKKITSFVGAHAGIQLQLTFGLTTDLAARVANGSLDCAITVGPAPAHLEKLRSYDLGRLPLSLAVAADHPLASTGSVRLEQVRNDLFIFAEVNDANGFATSVMESLRHCGIIPRKMTGIFPTQMILNLVAENIGVSLIAESAAQPRPDVVLLKIVESPVISVVLLVGQRNSKPLERLVEWLIAP
jgi:DNA-binding transcriptional LysR family regulator